MNGLSVALRDLAPTSPEQSPDNLQDRAGVTGARATLVTGLAAFVVVFGLTLFIISPRFAISGPSTLDDWSALDNAPRALDAVASLHYDPERVGDPLRYRPAYEAIWNSLQWHTLGAPRSMVGPNLWNALRIALFIGALMAIPLAVCRPWTTRLSAQVRIGLLASIPPLLVVTTPTVGHEFARFGPVEPMLVAGMVGGGALLTYLTGRWIASGGRPQLFLAAGLVLAYALWLAGTYHKEASVTFLAAAPFLYFYLDRHWRASGYTSRPLFRYRPFQLLAVAMLLPIVHMAWEIKKIAGHGTTVYGTPVPKGGAGALGRLEKAFDVEWSNMDTTLLTSLWRFMLIAVPVGIVVLVASRRRIPWLALALIAAAWAALVFQGLSATATTRYYIPTMALSAVAAILLVAKSRPWIQTTAIALGVLFALNNASLSRQSVVPGVSDDKDSNRAVELVAKLNPDRCGVYLGGMELEPAGAFPVLAREAAPFPDPPCRAGTPTFLVARVHPERVQPATNERIWKACAEPGWRRYERTRIWQILSCRRLKRGAVDRDPVSSILAEDKLIPGRRIDLSSSAVWRARDIVQSTSRSRR